MKLTLSLFVLFLFPVVATAQSIGIGGGAAMSTSAMSQLPQNLRDQGWTALEKSVADGFYIELRGRIGVGLPLTGAISYNRFPEETSQYTDGSGSTFEVVTSQVVIPASVGFEYPFSDGMVAPFASVEGTGSYVYRTFEYTDGEVPLPLRTEQQGDARFGGAVGLGLKLELPLVRIDATARYHLLNLFGRDGDEDLMSFGQLGVVLWVGL